MRGHPVASNVESPGMAPAPLALSTLDGVVLGLVAILAIRGAFKGFVWQLFRTGGLILGLLLAARWNAGVGRWMDERLPFVPSAGADVVGWVTVLVGVVLVVTLVAHLARDAVHEVRLAGLDRTLGFALGGLLGLGLAAFGFVLWASFQDPAEIHSTFQGSLSVDWMARFVDAVKPLFPDSVHDRWGPVLDSLR